MSILNVIPFILFGALPNYNVNVNTYNGIYYSIAPTDSYLSSLDESLAGDGIHFYVNYNVSFNTEDEESNYYIYADGIQLSIFSPTLNNLYPAQTYDIFDITFDRIDDKMSIEVYIDRSVNELYGYFVHGIYGNFYTRYSLDFEFSNFDYMYESEYVGASDVYHLDCVFAPNDLSSWINIITPVVNMSSFNDDVTLVLKSLVINVQFSADGSFVDDVSDVTFLTNYITKLETELFQKNNLIYQLNHQIELLQNNLQFDVTNFLWDIVDFPFRLIGNILNFEIFGINIASIVFGFMSILIVLAIVRFIRK